MDKREKYSSALKVGILTLSAISILIFTVLWVKGRSLSGGERIDISFKDINGMRAGSQVHMMGLRIGQVEEITPVINGKDSFIKLRFVITEKGVKIPEASTISIQQSGIIGEQFLEVTPPLIETIYNETDKAETSIQKKQPIYMQLSEGEKEIGIIDDVEIIKKAQLPYMVRKQINSKYALKLSYTIELPGLILDKELVKAKIKNDKLIFYLSDGEIPETPRQDIKYTVIEPTRLSDFMDMQFRAAKSLAETNSKISSILSDEFIGSLTDSVENIRELTKNANTTLDKASSLIDSSKQDIESLVAQSESLITSLTDLSNNLNVIVSDETIKNDVLSSIRSVGKMSDNVNKMLEDAQAREMLENVDCILKNLSEISSYVNEYTKDEKLKQEITSTVENLSSITTNIARVMDDYNKLNDDEKLKLKSTVKDILIITKNVKKFSEKLNKRFLLFRLMF